MSRKKEGAAAWEATRSNVHPARIRIPVNSLTETSDGDGLGLSPVETLASIAVGFLSMFALMWLAAAF